MMTAPPGFSFSSGITGDGAGPHEAHQAQREQDRHHRPAGCREKRLQFLGLWWSIVESWRGVGLACGEDEAMKDGAVQQWQLVGQWFDACKCSVPCPCSFAQPPTSGDCEGVLLWHIDEGRYGGTSLNALNVVMLGSFVGNIWAEHTDSYAAIFMDATADEEQLAALQMIFGGRAGGWPAMFVEMSASELRGVEVAPIHAWIAEDLSAWSVEVPGRAAATVQALSGPTTPQGARVQSHNLPGAEVGPGQVATWGVATSYRADAFGFTFERSGGSSKHFGFNWSGPGR
jgi:hypothetical protein